MEIDLKKELPLLLLFLAPFVYLFFIWAELPKEVPIHYNINGIADNFSSKTVFALILLAMSTFTYLLMFVLPFIDPKKQIKLMGKKFYHVKFITVGLISALCIFLIYKTIHIEVSIAFLKVILGAFFIALGNYFQTIKPNYFLGVRTPWTLQSDEIWTKTHKISGKLYMLAGIIIMSSYFMFSNLMSNYIMIAVILPLALFPFIYSFILFRKEKSIL